MFVDTLKSPTAFNRNEFEVCKVIKDEQIGYLYLKFHKKTIKDRIQRINSERYFVVRWTTGAAKIVWLIESQMELDPWMIKLLSEYTPHGVKFWSKPPYYRFDYKPEVHLLTKP